MILFYCTWIYVCHYLWIIYRCQVIWFRLCSRRWSDWAGSVSIVISIVVVSKWCLLLLLGSSELFSVCRSGCACSDLSITYYLITNKALILLSWYGDAAVLVLLWLEFVVYSTWLAPYILDIERIAWSSKQSGTTHDYWTSVGGGRTEAGAWSSYGVCRFHNPYGMLMIAELCEWLNVCCANGNAEPYPFFLFFI